LGKDFINGNRKKEKGLTIIEAVVALGIIVILSISAISVAVYTNNIQKRVAMTRYFTVLIDNSISLYLAYEGEDFQLAFNKLTNQSLTYNVDHTFYFDKDLNFTNEASSLYSAKYDFSANSLSIKALYDDGDVIYERSVTK